MYFILFFSFFTPDYIPFCNFEIWYVFANIFPFDFHYLYIPNCKYVCLVCIYKPFYLETPHLYIPFCKLSIWYVFTNKFPHYFTFPYIPNCKYDCLVCICELQVPFFIPKIHTFWLNIDLVCICKQISPLIYLYIHTKL